MVPFPYMGVSITKRYPTFLGFEWKRFASDHPPDDVDDGDGELLLDEDLHLAILARAQKMLHKTFGLLLYQLQMS